jgi:hypothetical protein
MNIRIFAYITSPIKSAPIRYGNVRKADLLHRFAAIWPGVMDALDRGESLVEVA